MELLDENVVTEYHVPYGICSLNVTKNICSATAFEDWIVISTDERTTFFKAEKKNNHLHFTKSELICTRMTTCFAWMKTGSTQKLLAGTESGTILIFRTHNTPEMIHSIRDGHSNPILGIADWHLTESVSKHLYHETEHGFLSADRYSVKIWKIVFTRSKTSSELLHMVTSPEIHFRSLLKIGTDFIWTAMMDDSIKIWKRNGDDLECWQDLPKAADAKCVKQLLLLDDTVVSTSSTNVAWWSLAGELLGSYPTRSGYYLDYGVWHNRLCSVSHEDIFLWCFHRSPVTKVVICAENIAGLVCWKYQNQEYLCTFFNNTLMVWEPFVTWEAIRVLWIGRMKNKASECLIATLPKEILKLVLSYLGWPLLRNKMEVKKRPIGVDSYFQNSSPLKVQRTE